MRNLFLITALLLSVVSFGQQDYQMKITNFKDLKVGQIAPDGIKTIVNKADFIETINSHFANESHHFVNMEIKQQKIEGAFVYYLTFYSNRDNRKMISMLDMENGILKLQPVNQSNTFRFFSCEGFCEPQISKDAESGKYLFYCQNLDVPMDSDLNEQFPCTKMDSLIEIADK